MVTPKTKNQTFNFFLRFSVIGINLLIRESIEVNISKKKEKDKEPLIDRFHDLQTFSFTYHFLPSDTKTMHSVMKFAPLKVKSEF